MEFIEAMKIFKRMCNGRACSDCPLCKASKQRCTCCTEYCSNYPEEAEEILKEWAEEHPQKTILKDFLEKYPNAPLNENGFPKVCPVGLGFYDSGCPFVSGVVDCKKCWNRPLEE